jgi:hypothetical protein
MARGHMRKAEQWLFDILSLRVFQVLSDGPEEERRGSVW